MYTQLGYYWAAVGNCWAKGHCVYTLLMFHPGKAITEGVRMRASDKAYAALRDDIIEWRLLPGTVLAEVEQSERLGISRTPLREALSRLTAEGLTTTAGGRGVVVTDISLEDIDELFELRETLEGRAAALAAERGDHATFEQLRRELLRAPELIGGQDPALHDYYGLVGRLDAAIDAAISNAYLVQAMRSLRVHLVRVRRLAADDAARLTAAAAEHAAIAEAIAAGNPRLAEAATTLHLHRSLSHVKATHTPQQREHHG
jgi:DNA-binding GntR family transcriptional regulator